MSRTIASLLAQVRKLWMSGHDLGTRNEPIFNSLEIEHFTERLHAVIPDNGRPPYRAPVFTPTTALLQLRREHRM